MGIQVWIRWTKQEKKLTNKTFYCKEAKKTGQKNKNAKKKCGTKHMLLKHGRTVCGK